MDYREVSMIAAFVYPHAQAGNRIEDSVRIAIRILEESKRQLPKKEE